MTSMWTIGLILLVLALIAAGGITGYACAVPSSQVLWRAFVRGPAEGHRVALTFDDGPAPPFTEQILDILRERGVPATFFVCGKNAERFPQMVRRIHAEGHALGNHTYAHPFLCFRSRKRIAGEIDRTQSVIEEATGRRPRLFRPPYGIRWFGLLPVLRERGMSLVQWSDTGYDWKSDTDAIVRATLDKLAPGAIILLHDGHEPAPRAGVNKASTVKALPAIIEGARNAGLTFVTLPELLATIS